MFRNRAELAQDVFAADGHGIADIKTRPRLVVVDADDAEVDGEVAGHCVVHFQPERPAVRLAVDGVVDEGAQRTDLVYLVGVGDQVDQRRRRVEALFRLAGMRRLAAADDHQSVDGIVKFKAAGARVRQSHEALFVVVGRIEQDVSQIRHSVDRLAGAELREHRRFVGRGADLDVQDTLFGIADAVVAVGRERQIGQRLLLEIALHVGHAGFLGNAVDRAQGVFALYAQLLERAHTVERHHGSALVVGNAPAVESAVALGQRKRRHRPAVAGRHHVKMRQNAADLAAAAEVDLTAFVGHALGNKSEILRAAEHVVQRLPARFVVLAVDGFDAHQGVEVGEEFVGIG